jgi:predicted RecB family nuclease
VEGLSSDVPADRVEAVCVGFARSVLTVPGVTRATAAALHAEGVHTISDLLATYTEDALAALEHSRGSRTVRVGGRARGILRSARALLDGRPIPHGPLSLPTASPVALFDLEGVPGLGEMSGQVYLWGTKVVGEVEGAYVPVFAAQGPSGDEHGWHQFLDHAAGLFDEFGAGLPFVHWASYERSQVRQYLERYGDRNGAGAQVLSNLVDLLGVVRAGLTLPVRSYSLKVVEDYVGFRRSQTEFGGDWSITIWQEVLEALTEDRRSELLRELAVYNEEDLLGMWAVYRWLQAWR